LALGWLALEWYLLVETAGCLSDLVGRKAKDVLVDVCLG